MYSCSATLQDYVSREVYHMTGKWLEEFIDRRLQEIGVCAAEGCDMPISRRLQEMVGMR